MPHTMQQQHKSNRPYFTMETDGIKCTGTHQGTVSSPNVLMHIMWLIIMIIIIIIITTTTIIIMIMYII